MVSLRRLLIAILIASGTAALSLRAGDVPCCPGSGLTCPQCGCAEEAEAVCRIVPDVQKVTQTTFRVECEEVCLPGKSRYVGHRWRDLCPPCGFCRDACWEPCCGPIVTKKKLKKEMATIDKPGYKCVVEYICPRCSTRFCPPAAK